MTYQEGVYRGGTESKSIARHYVWLKHQQLLGDAFLGGPHVFLASQVAGDIPVLRSMGVSPRNIWAVEKDRAQYAPLIVRQVKERFRLFTFEVEVLAEGLAKDEGVRSVYLDYCGNLHGMANSMQRVVAQLPSKSALSVTLFRGREQDGLSSDEERESLLLKHLRKRAPHPVTLVQSIHYMSSSPMMTWTFFIGAPQSHSKMRFDLTAYEGAQITALANSEIAVKALWLSKQREADRRTRAAVQANLTRRVRT